VISTVLWIIGVFVASFLAFTTLEMLMALFFLAEKEHQMTKSIRSRLVLSGMLFGFLSVGAIYLILYFLSVTQDIVYWSLFLVPFNALPSIFPTSRSLAIAIRKFGEKHSLMQIYTRAFYSFSLIAVIAVNALRYSNVIP